MVGRRYRTGDTHAHLSQCLKLAAAARQRQQQQQPKFHYVKLVQ